MLHHINLMEWQQIQAAARFKRFVGCILFGILLFICIQISLWMVLEKALAVADAQHQTLVDEKAQLEQRASQWQSRQAAFNQTQEALSQIQHWKEMTRVPYRLMSLIAESVTAHVYLHSLNLSGRQVVLRGYGDDAENVSLFLSKLRIHPCHCVQRLKMEAVKQMEQSQDQVQRFRLSFSFSTSDKTRKG
ncbi:PilN domain-containing protein [Vibrio quintilis]|uniref:Fimbrial assembly protein (PilN) n=1 Tax=Vibrio quintilis TaxID=1117707 RepID=A0A1M7YQ56_9VIBR|nr:PilN domain-containing protein [Vibrio quintilis]SHO54771.1 hypothetical protein VQ7734_00489 [Vibrio quintilis]